MRLFSDPAAGVAEPMLARAYHLAESGRGRTAPNPMVGCVIVRDGEIVGEGFHERSGAPHAEAVALAQAADRARGATVYVTLEPCNHQGRTPPCANALIAAEVAEVVVGMADPNPAVTGGGAAVLRDAGIGVRFADDPAPFEMLNEAWLKWLRSGLPWLDVKVALTLDGRPALSQGRRTRISGAEAQGITMRLRAAADAVMVGAATQAIDDPLLTVRYPDGTDAAHQPLRVVLARTAIPRSDARVLDQDAGPAVVLMPDGRSEGCAALRAAGVECVEYAERDGIAGALRALGERSVTRVLLEAGPGLFSSAWEAGVIDRLTLITAGGVGGMAAPALYLGEAEERDASLTRRMRCVEAGIAGDDAVVVWERFTRG